MKDLGILETKWLEGCCLVDWLFK